MRSSGCVRPPVTTRRRGRDPISISISSNNEIAELLAFEAAKPSAP
jgi:hypothetical protein